MLSTVASHTWIVDTGYAKTSKELIQFVSTLRALGAQVILDLPPIVVIGNQSAGKSSLVEAISGISVPRDAGTCTRAPMECRMAHSPDSWSCQLFIRWEFDAYGDRLDEVREVPFGVRLTDKAAVEPMLRRAQAAVLNPTVSLSDFLDADIEEIKAGRIPGDGASINFKTLQFSKNVICVDLAGPELADLSFVDLPGIVQNAEADVVRLVEELVTSYVQGNCIILVTLPMSDDIENQKAARIAKLADPHGSRTIGVLTKPDTLPAGATKSREMWLDVMEGRRHVLNHGYYCTRQPDDDQRLRGISPADARDEEAAFFRSTAPWSTSIQQDQFGTTNLVKSISELLTKVISDSLPKLLGEVALQLEACKTQLGLLPPQVTTEPAAFVFNLIVTFCAEVLRHVEGSPTHTELVQSNKTVYLTFKQAVLSTAPPYVPFESGKAPDEVSKYTKLDGEEDLVVQVASKKKGKTRVVPVLQSPVKVIYLDDVRARIKASVTRELPNNVPYAAKRALIMDYQRSWDNHAQSCFDRVQETFKEMLLQLMRKNFDQYNNLKGVVIPVVLEQLQHRAHLATAHVQMILRLEKAAPFTQNTHYLAEKRDKQLSKYRHARRKHGDTAQTEPGDDDPDMNETIAALEKLEYMKEAIAALAKLGYYVNEEDLGRLHPPDEFEEELQLMAEVRAYFQVAYKRVIDYVPLSIDEHFLYGFAQGLQAVLFERLGLGTSNADSRCASYIAEESSVVSLRAQLLTKKKQLLSIQNALFNFGLSSVDDST